MEIQIPILELLEGINYCLRVLFGQEKAVIQPRDIYKYFLKIQHTLYYAPKSSFSSFL